MKNKLRWSTQADLSIVKHPSVSREEYLDIMTFKRHDRALFTEIWGPLIGLKEEWSEQGATPEELDFSAFRYRLPSYAAVAVNTRLHGGYPEKVLEETSEYRIWTDGLGRTLKLPKGVATLPLPLDFPVRTMDDWLRIRPWYEYTPARFEADWEARARHAVDEGRVITVSIPGGFDEPRQLLGEEGLCLAFYENPELVHDMLRTIGDTAYRVLDEVSSRIPVDILGVHEDMAGKSGSLVGPTQIREFIGPYYRRIWDMLHSRGARLFSQDSDGNMNSVIPAFMEAGVNCMFPMEPAAGMDIVALRKQYGTRLAFAGGIDKHVLRRSKDEIEQELEYKLPPMLLTGGCDLGLDHRVPNGTPLDHYRFYIAKAWEIIERTLGPQP
jgi:hypothetical protein